MKNLRLIFLSGSLLFSVSFFVTLANAQTALSNMPNTSMVTDASLDVEVYDPYESFNRKMMTFNDKAFVYILKPLTRCYNFIIPNKAQKHINNVFTNVQMPKRFFNNLFQKKYKGAGIEFNRFLINSTVGVAGIFDPAAHFWNLNEHNEDFGQTLGVYGMKEGRYFVLPVFGPTTTRDMFGWVGNLVLDPFFWIGVYDVEPEDAFLVARLVNGVNSFAYKAYDPIVELQESSIEPYVSLRDAYIKIRRNQIQE